MERSLAVCWCSDKLFWFTIWINLINHFLRAWCFVISCHTWVARLTSWNKPSKRIASLSWLTSTELCHEFELFIISLLWHCIVVIRLATKQPNAGKTLFDWHRRQWKQSWGWYSGIIRVDPRTYSWRSEIRKTRICRRICTPYKCFMLGLHSWRSQND